MANLSNINNKFLVTTGGDVGVGVTSPGSKLSIGGTTGSYTSGIGFQPIGTGARIYRTFIGTDGSFRFDDVTAGFATRLTINSSGNVGIGVSTPSDYYAKNLVVTGPAEGGITIASTGNHTNYLLFADSTSGVARYAGMVGYAHDTDLMSFRTNSIQRMAIDSSGNVGIGTTSPDEKLDVDGKVQVTGTSLTVLNASDPNVTVSDTDTNYKGAMRWLSSSNVLEFFTRYGGTYYTNNLVLDRGKVGIGTDSPQGKLDSVAPAADLTDFGRSTGSALNIRIANVTGHLGQINFCNDAAPAFGYGSIGMVMTSGSGVGLGDMVFGTKSSGSAVVSSERMRITSGGNVAIGGTLGADSQFRVELKPSTTILAGLRIGYNNSSNNYYDADTHHFRAGSGAADLVVINSAGNVGIGYTNPSQAFVVKDGMVVTGANSIAADTSGGYICALGANSGPKSLHTKGYITADGGIRLGGSASANQLDYYEEGTWTPVAYASSSTLTGAYSQQLGTYTKVGRQVICMFDFTVVLSGTMSGFAGISGLPFTVGTNSYTGGSMAGYSVVQYRSSSLFAITTTGKQIKGFPQQGATYIYCQLDNSGTGGFAGSSQATWNIGSSGRCTGYVIYFVD